jgi:hypothetical protein
MLTTVEVATACGARRSVRRLVLREGGDGTVTWLEYAVRHSETCG